MFLNLKNIEKLDLWICFCFENLPSKYIATINNIVTQPLIIRLTFDRAKCKQEKIFLKFEFGFWRLHYFWLFGVKLFSDWYLEKDVSIKFQCTFSIFTFYRWIFWQTCWFLLDAAVYVMYLKVLFFDVKLKVGIFWEGHKIWKNVPLKIWRYWVPSNFKWKIFLNFVAFSEYPNFT